jgi:predicted phage tail protein
LLVTINIHSAFKNLFSNLQLKADINKYADIPYYLGSLHPHFKNYVKAIDNGECFEGYALLDSNLNPIKDQDLFIKAAKQDDVFYVVPSIVGGGGKRGNMLLLAALAIAAPGIGSMIGGGTFLGGYGAVGTSIASTVGMAAPTAGTGAALSIGQAVGINAGLALVTSYFTSKPDDIRQTDQAVRANNMFGGLQNTIDSGTPIPLIYGMHRLTGQLISGYLDTVDHGRDDVITVESRFST